MVRSRALHDKRDNGNNFIACFCTPPMFFNADIDTVSNGIKLAVAPVFLLTAMATMISTVAGRLARIIDRARTLEDRINANPDAPHIEHDYRELRRLRQRGWLTNACIALLTLCGMLIGLTILALFLGETTEIPIFRMTTLSFLGGIASFLLALMTFLAETVLSTRILKFERIPNRTSKS
jgi:hypothetical protein